jgi:sugar-phosphatase
VASLGGVPPRAAIFDLDGTIADSEPRSAAAWRRAFEDHGLPPDEAVIRSFIGRRGADVVTVLASAYPGLDAEALIMRMRSHGNAPALPPVGPLPGAVELVRQVHDHGHPLGLVTSASRPYAERILDGFGLLELFDAVITSEDVDVGKPDPQGFRAGAVALGVDAAYCVVFEDAPAGVTAAKAAGMRCVAVATTHDPAELAGADLVVADLTKITWPPRF